MSTRPAPVVFDLDRAAEAMCVSKETLKRAIRAGKLRAKKSSAGTGGKHLVSAADLDAWFESLEDV